MSDEKSSEQVAAPPVGPPQGMLTVRSPHYRIIYSNFVRYRLGPGDFVVVFGALSETPGSPVTNLLQEEVQIAMSWAQLKMLATFLRETVEVVEGDMGEIPIPDTISPFENARKESLLSALRASGYTQPRR